MAVLDRYGRASNDVVPRLYDCALAFGSCRQQHFKLWVKSLLDQDSFFRVGHSCGIRCMEPDEEVHASSELLNLDASSLTPWLLQSRAGRYPRLRRRQKLPTFE